jgi:DNA-binding beta-propeller fold protein YncE
MSAEKNKIIRIGLVFLGLIIALGLVQTLLDKGIAAQGGNTVMAPRFEVDPFWPKPLPNGWVLGSSIGVNVDAQDNVWILHRPDVVDDNLKAAAVKPPVGTCCTPAPAVLEFDKAGNLKQSFGGPYAPSLGWEWLAGQHGIRIDPKGNVWLGSNDNKDSRVVKLSQQGKLLLELGTKGLPDSGSLDQKNLGRPTNTWVDAAANEVYVSDGYGNRRVIVFDADSGAFKRLWGAYGHKPDDAKWTYNPDGPPPQQFGNPVHCVVIAKDGLVYVCDRSVDRLQVFQKDGTFVKEKFLAPKTQRSGAVWDIALSKDPNETYMYVADGVNERVYVLNRQTLEVLTSFGSGGRHPGQFYGVHNLATDSAGNLYTTETYNGARVQKFVYKGITSLPRQDPNFGPGSAQGVPWPK